MDFGAFIIAFGGLILAGLSVYLSYKSRISPYREMLYAKQLEGYAEVVYALSDFFTTALGFITVQKGCRLDDNTRVELRSYTLDKNQTFFRKKQNWAIFLSKEISDSLSDFVKLFSGISAPSDVAHQYSKEIVYADDPGLLLANAYTKVIEVARKSLGTEPLSQETLKLFGEVPPNKMNLTRAE